MNIYTSIIIDGESSEVTKWCFNHNIEICLTGDTESILHVRVLEDGFLVNENYYSTWNEVVETNCLVPKVYSQVKYDDDYLIPLAYLIKKRQQIYKDELNRFFLEYDVDSTMFCDLSGAIKIFDFEWVMIDDAHPLKKMFNKKQDDSYVYCLEEDDYKLLRGVAIYYFFSAHSKAQEYCGNKITGSWFHNVLVMLEEINDAISLCNDPALFSMKLYLAVFDNLRNIVLMYLNISIYCEYGLNSFSCKIDNHLPTHINIIIQCVELYQELFFSIVSKKNVHVINDKIKFISNSLVGVTSVLKSKIEQTENEHLLKKIFFPVPRENDSYIENCITIRHCIEQCDLYSLNDTELIGILSGALELPFIAKYILKNDLIINLIHQNHESYNMRQFLSPGFVQFKERKHCQKSAIIMDDNIMCGYTMQHLINYLTVEGYSIKEVWIIKYPDLGRLAQVQFFGHTLNFESVDKFIKGLLIASKYTKVDKKNIEGCFLNEFGVYSQNTDLIFRSIYKNGYYLDNSAVNIFRGYNAPHLKELIIEKQDE